TLRMLSTLLPPTGGEATVAGCDLRREPNKVRERIGYVGRATRRRDRTPARHAGEPFRAAVGAHRPRHPDHGDSGAAADPALAAVRAQHPSVGNRLDAGAAGAPGPDDDARLVRRRAVARERGRVRA